MVETTLRLEEFTCPVCGRISQDPHDVKARYCGWCHWWTGDPAMASIRRDVPLDRGAAVWPAEPGGIDQVIRGVAWVTPVAHAGRHVRSF
ncbi:MAG TPA: hypothetical protein VGJ28_02805 [Micromonosporaceae bacterium]|jgi:hypothetical protein